MNKTEKRKITLKITELVTFALGLLLIFMCAGDGIWNGRLLLGLVLLIVSYKAEKKYYVMSGKEGK